VLRAALFLVGLGLVCGGLAMVSIPVALVCGGLALAVVAVAMEVAAQRGPGEAK